MVKGGISHENHNHMRALSDNYSYNFGNHEIFCSNPSSVETQGYTYDSKIQQAYKQSSLKPKNAAVSPKGRKTGKKVSLSSHLVEARQEHDQDLPEPAV